MQLIGKRIDLRALTLRELSMAVDDYARLEDDLGVRIPGTLLDDEMQYALRIRLSKVLQDEENYPWLTSWAIIHREEQRIIGFLILKGSPNEQGEVIIGYVINKNHQRKGFATEALEMISGWIFSHPRAIWIIADTEKDNFASHKLLQHMGAQPYRETEDLLWWRIARPKLA